MNEQIDLSIIVSTYNRCDRLPGALQNLLGQVGAGLRYEVIVVDNNSTDQTRAVIEGFAAKSGGRLRYVFEGQQGVSFGRNAGVAQARGSLIAFTDDDMRMPEDWAAKLKRAFDEHPQIDCVGGKVLPRWLALPPAWLTPRHWSPIALLDYGPAPLVVDWQRQQTLITANFAIRRDALERIGGFSPLAQRVTNDVCSAEDHELLLRLWRAGGRGLYLPDLIGWAEVPPKRLTKDYHRRWHRGHGRCLAMMCVEELEPSAAGRLFDIPAHLFRQALLDVGGYLRHWFRGHDAEAFWCETRLWFFAGFVEQRYQDYCVTKRCGWGREVGGFVRALLFRRLRNATVKGGV